jgi:leucyl/phenylalanyl-tRNA--protein transferase
MGGNSTGSARVDGRILAMPIFRLGRDLAFPHPEDSDPSGLLAVGGDLQPDRLLLAYASGIFPWYSNDQPILWHSPDPRAVLEPASLHVPRSLAKVLRQGRFEVRLDTAFAAVIRACADAARPGGGGTWITREMQHAYCALHEQGFAHSAEAFVDGRLVGGLYGVSLGSIFFGESMFARVPDASKVAFVVLVRQLVRWGFELIDCQQHTAHLARFGAVMWSRSCYLDALARCTARPTRRGVWHLAPEQAPRSEPKASEDHQGES